MSKFFATPPDSFTVFCAHCGERIEPHFDHMFGGEWVHVLTGETYCKEFRGGVTLIG